MGNTPWSALFIVAQINMLDGRQSLSHSLFKRICSESNLTGSLICALVAYSGRKTAR